MRGRGFAGFLGFAHGFFESLAIQAVEAIALYDQGGVLVRSLLYAEPVEKGAQTITWDATTDLGKPVAAGSYAAKGTFFTTPPALKYVMKVFSKGSLYQIPSHISAKHFKRPLIS